MQVEKLYIEYKLTPGFKLKKFERKNIIIGGIKFTQHKKMNGSDANNITVNKAARVIFTDLEKSALRKYCNSNCSGKNSLDIVP